MSAGDEAVPAAGHAGRRALTSAVLPVGTSFALDLYRRLAEVGEGNLFLSPQSISTAMAMVLAGARGETADEISRVLQLPGGTVAGEDAYELTSANALWAAAELELSAAYVSLLHREFGATLEGVDFAHDTEGARRRINDWTDEATRHKIRELIPPGAISEETLLVLTNAIYMKALWALPFETYATRENEPFHTSGAQASSPVSMMAQQAYFPYLREDGVRVLALPYVGAGTSMIVVLPDAVDGLASIDLERFDSWRARLQPTNVDVRFPRLTIDGSFKLRAILWAMGIHLAFDATGRADFSAISSQPLTISEVIHQAHLDVTEEGTEAAAATAVVARAAAAPRKVETFHADHPFFFAILRRDNVLFCGRFTGPAA